MEETKQLILKLTGMETSDLMGYFEYYNGWLNTGDGRNYPDRFNTAIAHFKRSIEIYTQLHGTEESLENAENYRYYA